MSSSWHKGAPPQDDEPVLEPERPIVDPHHHLWFDVRGLPGPYLAANLLADLKAGGHRIEQLVYVEVPEVAYRSAGPPELRPVGETEFAVEQTAALDVAGGPRIGGIVGHADLLRGAAIQPVLEAHIAAGQGRFRGIRQTQACDPCPDIPRSCPPSGCCYGDLGFRAGIELLGQMGLSFDAWNYHPHLPDLTALARACPGTTIVVDHYGGPLGIGPYAEQRDTVFEQWRKDLAELAQCPNVVVKLGGLAMPMMGFGYIEAPTPPHSEALAERQRPYFEHALACFGVARAMFESNFPAERRVLSYRVIWNAFKRLAAPLSESEKAALFQDTAKRVYKLP
jgi:predicted TIM-barrel fold metal-dependent hydrolase